MKPILYYTCIQVRDLDEGVRFFTDVLGYETVGARSDKMNEKMKKLLSKEVMPKLFGFDNVEECEFRSQLVAPKGNHSTFYNIFEWVNPKWVDDEYYESTNHCGLVRSQMAVEGYDDLKKKIEEYPDAKFVCPEVRWAGFATGNNPISYSRAGSVRHNSGALFQLKQNEDDELSALPGRAVKVNHRAIHCKDVERSIAFYKAIGLVSDTSANPYSRNGHTHFLVAPYKNNFSMRYINYWSQYQVQQLFGYSYEDTPAADCDVADFMLADAVDRKSNQNLDIFQWIEPKVYGEPYSVANHIGMQRICFYVDNFDEVKATVASIAKKVICDEVNFPEITPVGLENEKPCTRAMSLLDPDGVFLMILGN